ncbi:LPXTG cell wall anchor domain-containing protein [Levilactobacillus humaensis]|uniref:LPXTG cell wall anchor domain-containing protein n=1 Tax=Levilactobacillus humaensis TaxID=2950375 RepID=UPI0021C479EA|nr:LPXTG cell wall anchor domain-containing protein [Levilactobacillus humaensis]
MKKLILRVVLVLTLVLGLGASTPALALDVYHTGRTEAGITFTPNPNAKPTVHNGSSGALVDPKIPSAKKPTVTKTKTKPSTGVLVRSAAADVIAGKLPQTNEVQALLVSMVGFLLLIVLMLLALIYRQARLLRERG